MKPACGVSKYHWMVLSSILRTPGLKDEKPRRQFFSGFSVSWQTMCSTAHTKSSAVNGSPSDHFISRRRWNV